MPTRRELLKGGGGAVLVGLAGYSVGADVLGAATPSGASESSEAALGEAAAAAPGFRPGGPGPLYWSTYDYENVLNTIIPEDVWKTNIDWVAETFRDYGYTMACTDGWIDNTQKITATGTSSARRTTGSTTGRGGPVPEVQGNATRRLLQPSVGHEVSCHRSLGHRRGAARHQGGRHRQPERLFRRRRAVAVGRHHPRRSRGVRQGLCVATFANWGRCSSASTSSRTTRPDSTRTTGPWGSTTAVIPTCGRSGGCARRRETCSSASSCPTCSITGRRSASTAT